MSSAPGIKNSGANNGGYNQSIYQSQSLGMFYCLFLKIKNTRKVAGVRDEELSPCICTKATFSPKECAARWLELADYDEKTVFTS